MEIGIVMAPLPRRVAVLARMAEQAGFASLLLPDSQNLTPDVWQQLALAANATTTIRLGTGVTNPLTRDVAVTASAALTLQVESGGRAICGVGRGDSSVQRIGKRPLGVEDFERYLCTLQDYLKGASVDRSGFASRLEWLRPGTPKVPVEVAATGRRVVEVAARRADRIALAVGADPGHVAAMLGAARAAARASGRDPAEIRFGVYVNCAIHPDPALARDAVRGTVATFTRFSSYDGASTAKLPPPLRDAAEALRRQYDMKVHTRAAADHARALEDRFIDWFAITGPAESALRRFRDLAALGLDFCHVVPGGAEMGREIAGAILQAIAKEIVPAVR